MLQPHLLEVLGKPGPLSLSPQAFSYQYAGSISDTETHNITEPAQARQMAKQG
jgi:hypothetical protein